MGDRGGHSADLRTLAASVLEALLWGFVDAYYQTLMRFLVPRIIYTEIRKGGGSSAVFVTDAVPPETTFIGIPSEYGAINIMATSLLSATTRASSRLP
jgi:hypothetical protein